MRSALIRWFPSNKPKRVEKKISLIDIFTVAYIEAITKWGKDKNIMFEWQEQYLTSEHSK